MKVVVTGGTGFVGASIARVLSDEGHEVVATFRSAPRDDVLRYLAAGKARVELVQADVAYRERMAELFAEVRPDALVHAAVQTTIAPELEATDPDRMIESNVLGTTSVMAAAGLHGVSRAVYVSSSAVFPASSIGDPPFTETDPARPTRLYGITKYTSELIWRRMAELHRISAASARIVAPYGPLESASNSRSVMSPMQEWITAARERKPVRLPTWPASKDWTYVVDTARAIALLVTSASLRHDLYNVGCGRMWTVEEVVAAIRRHYPEAKIEYEADASKLNPSVGPFGLKAMLAIDRIREDVGFTPAYDLDSGVAAYAAWLESDRA